MPLGWVARVAREHPFKFGCVFSCAKTSFSDALVQYAVERRDKIDWKRNATFATFGLVYLGGVQYSIYVPFFSRLFPGAKAFAAAPLAEKIKDATGMRNMLAQVFIDQFVHHPLMYFPAFYCLKEMVHGGELSAGIQKYRKNMNEDLVALWKLWVPSTIINFTFMPMHMRIPWVATTSLLWTCILSAMRGSSDDVELTPEAAESLFGNQGRAIEALLNWSVSEKPLHHYNPLKEHLLLTATGRDRTGFVAQLTTAVEGVGGNVLDARMNRVGSDFVTMMLIETDRTVADKARAVLHRLPNMTVNVSSTKPTDNTSSLPHKTDIKYVGRLSAIGPDKPGVLRHITQLLSDAGLDITFISCNQHWQRSSDTNELQKLFVISGLLRSFEDVDERELNERLQSVELATGMRIGVREVQLDPSTSAFGSFSIPSTASKLRTALTKRYTGAPSPETKAT